MKDGYQRAGSHVAQETLPQIEHKLDLLSERALETARAVFDEKAALERDLSCCIDEGSPCGRLFESSSG